MANPELRGIATTAKLGSHPIHPMLIPFPIALMVATFLCDLAFWGSGNLFWADAAYWALLAAIVGAALAATAGFIDFLGNAHIRAMNAAWQHMIGNVVVVVLALVSFWMRLTAGPAEAVLPWGLVLSTAVVALLLFTGWKGGDMVYEHRVGMQPEAPAETSASVPHDRGLHA
jgi:uncharacterized membrane protein